jgi:hypothetical protein
MQEKDRSESWMCRSSKKSSVFSASHWVFCSFATGFAYRPWSDSWSPAFFAGPHGLALVKHAYGVEVLAELGVSCFFS